ncbi:hypothetical protein CJF35_02965 [Pseudomonas lundensis]|uniref:hypothetical protein n=2 Tax=Pseudomonas lundensis TaxID=86185 RepID=UPI000BA2B996|nr:hypothetical protein [Pseudomonas lundensis]OZY38544.1 hypothetical protein CJF35_02965 [Pseudomonas lundensis]
MSEVKRYHVTETGLVEGESLGRLSVVLAADFDRVTAERDAALAELGRYQSLFNQAQKAIDRLNELHRKRMAEIGRRLTAADERADVLEGLLREVQKSARKQDWANGYPTLFASVDAALKPAEGVGDDTTLEEDREDFKKVFVRINTKQGQSISLADMIARYEKKP